MRHPPLFYLLIPLNITFLYSSCMSVCTATDFVLLFGTGIVTPMSQCPKQSDTTFRIILLFSKECSIAMSETVQSKKIELRSPIILDRVVTTLFQQKGSPLGEPFVMLSNGTDYLSYFWNKERRQSISSCCTSKQRLLSFMVLQESRGIAKQLSPILKPQHFINPQAGVPGKGSYRLPSRISLTLFVSSSGKTTWMSCSSQIRINLT